MSGGGGGLIARTMAQVNDASRPGGSVPGYVAPSQLAQGSRPVNHIAPSPQPAPQQISPFVQQMMMQRQMPQFNPYQQQMMDLPGLLMQMQGRLNQPMMRGPMPMYQNPALGFRPNIDSARQNLNRVASPVTREQMYPTPPPSPPPSGGD